jgi:hypothetical protein
MKKKKEYLPPKNSEIRVGDIVYFYNEESDTSLGPVPYELSGYNEQQIIIRSIDYDGTPHNNLHVQVELIQRNKSAILSDFFKERKHERDVISRVVMSVNIDEYNFIPGHLLDCDERYIALKNRINNIIIKENETKFFIPRAFNALRDRGYKKEYIVEHILAISPTSKYIIYTQNSRKKMISVLDARITKYKSEDIKIKEKARIFVSIDGHGGSVNLEDIVVSDGYLTDTAGSFFIDCDSDLGKKILNKMK